jgi:Ulp1 family protease
MFNTYLIEKLKSCKKDNGQMGTTIDIVAFEKAYYSVKKWTKDVDIFEKEYLIFPYNDSGQKHWSLYIVCFPNYITQKQGKSSALIISYFLDISDPRDAMIIKPFLLYLDSFALMDHLTASLISL